LKIGVISDTHGLFDDRLTAIFEGVDAIIHAGDIGKLDVIQKLEQIAPVLAVEGNNDWFGLYPTERVERMAGRQVLIRHIFGELHQIEAAERARVERLRPDVVVFGHSHRAYRAELGETVLFNPGSAGPRRFSLPRTVGMLTFEGERALTRIIELEGTK
jgi:putative phosphoesterase